MPIVLNWRNSPQVRKYMFTNHIISMEEHKLWFQSNQKDPTSRWYVHSNEHGELDGVVCFSDINEIVKSATWGFYLGNEAKPGAGTGLGKDGLNEAFNSLLLEKVFARVLPHNTKSLHFHRKLGFIEDGCVEKSHFDGSQYLDVHLFLITRNIWEQKYLELNTLEVPGS